MGNQAHVYHILLMTQRSNTANDSFEFIFHLDTMQISTGFVGRFLEPGTIITSLSQNALTHKLEYEHPNIQNAGAIDVPLLDNPAHHFHH
jgi:hypothetical protein